MPKSSSSEEDFLDKKMNEPEVEEDQELWQIETKKLYRMARILKLIIESLTEEDCILELNWLQKIVDEINYRLQLAGPIVTQELTIDSTDSGFKTLNDISEIPTVTVLEDIDDLIRSTDQPLGQTQQIISRYKLYIRAKIILGDIDSQNNEGMES